MLKLLDLRSCFKSERVPPEEHYTKHNDYNGQAPQRPPAYHPHNNAPYAPQYPNHANTPQYPNHGNSAHAEYPTFPGNAPVPQYPPAQFAGQPPSSANAVHYPCYPPNAGAPQVQSQVQSRIAATAANMAQYNAGNNASTPATYQQAPTNYTPPQTAVQSPPRPVDLWSAEKPYVDAATVAPPPQRANAAPAVAKTPPSYYNNTNTPPAAQSHAPSQPRPSSPVRVPPTAAVKLPTAAANLRPTPEVKKVSSSDYHQRVAQRVPASAGPIADTLPIEFTAKIQQPQVAPPRNQPVQANYPHLATNKPATPAWNPPPPQPAASTHANGTPTLNPTYTPPAPKPAPLQSPVWDGSNPIPSPFHGTLPKTSVNPTSSPTPQQAPVLAPPVHAYQPPPQRESQQPTQQQSPILPVPLRQATPHITPPQTFQTPPQPSDAPDTLQPSAFTSDNCSDSFTAYNDPQSAPPPVPVVAPYVKPAPDSLRAKHVFDPAAPVARVKSMHVYDPNSEHGFDESSVSSVSSIQLDPSTAAAKAGLSAVRRNRCDPGARDPFAMRVVDNFSQSVFKTHGDTALLEAQEYDDADLFTNKSSAWGFEDSVQLPSGGVGGGQLPVAPEGGLASFAWGSQAIPGGQTTGWGFSTGLLSEATTVFTAVLYEDLDEQITEVERLLDGVQQEMQGEISGYRLKGHKQRFTGRTSVVAFAEHMNEGSFALKFYCDKNDAKREFDIYRNQVALKLHLPDEYEAEDNEGGVFRLRDGTALPPFLAMPRALPLPEWYSMHTPSRVTVLETLSQVARRLEDLHNAGYVHNDIKPANVLLVERAHGGEPRWYITDFTTIAQSGEQVPARYTLEYASPEAVRGVAAMRARTFICSRPMDIWALGVIMFELLTAQPFFPHDVARDQMRDGLIGLEPLKIEENPRLINRIPKEGALRATVQRMLCREPATRPLASQVVQALHNCIRELTGASPLADVSREPEVDDIPATSITRQMSSNRMY